MSVITKGGDAGFTSLFNGRRVLKSDTRVMTYGLVDLLNSQLGVVLSQPLPNLSDHESSRRLSVLLDEMLEHLARKVQPELFNVGGLLATEHESDFFGKIPQISSGSITDMEKQVKDAEEILPPMRFFIMPRGNLLTAQAHVARATCRHVESVTVSFIHTHGLEEVPELAVIPKYLNRLSDYLFILARVAANAEAYDQEDKWVPHRS